MWLQKGASTTFVPAHMPETIARCLGDGWVECADPRAVVEVVLDLAAGTVEVVEPAAGDAPLAPSTRRPKDRH